jgi:glycosyltransferase involved in cell wall biosynthesis
MEALVRNEAERQPPLAEPSETPHQVGPAFESAMLRPFASMSLPEIARFGGLRHIEVVAWRDHDDPEAGGSELHAHRILSAWSGAGLSVDMTTSSVVGAPETVVRDGYRVARRKGRYAIFPSTLAAGLLGRLGQSDGLVEIWNGMPFFSPVWARCPRVVFLHHVHAEMWNMVLPPRLARFGNFIERRAAPPVYRHSRVITLSSSSKAEIVELLRLPAENISVVPPGVESRFSPGPGRSEVPLVLAVGRLVPVKRFELLIDALLRLKRRHPDLRAVIAGEGYERPALEARIRAAQASDWISLPGFVDDEALVELYRKAWVVASSSLREGWGMTVTEAGACGTPAVVSRIGGHKDAVIDHGSGFLYDGTDGMVEALDLVLSDDVTRKRLGIEASDHAARYRWDATARAVLAVLALEARQRGHAPKR